MAIPLFRNVAQLLVLAALVLPVTIYAQPNGTPKAELLQHDFTNKTAKEAISAGLSASKKHVIVVFVCGGDNELLENVRGTMKALLYNGFERIGLLWGNNFPGETKPSIGIYAGGVVYAVIEDAKADAHTEYALYKLVKDAYGEYITPLLEKSQQNQR